MDSIPAELYPKSAQDKYIEVPYEERWNYLKPVIVELYIGNYSKGGRATTLTQLANFMKTHYFFHAIPKQYRTHFEAWGIKKNAGKDIKDDAITALAKRKRSGASTSHVTLIDGREDQQLPPSKIVRHVKEQSRRRPPVERIAPGMLSSWNLPYESFVRSIRQNQDKPSPFGPLASTPDGLRIKSPDPLTPGREADAPSPNMQLVYRKAMENRARLFLQGRLEELVVSMSGEERKLVVNYFHDFYMKGISKARTWGRRLRDTQPVTDLVASPQIRSIEDSMTSSFHPKPLLSSSRTQSLNQAKILEAPTQLCNWSIHIPEPSGDARCTDPIRDPHEQPPTSFTSELRQSILSNSFTSSPHEDFPLAQKFIVRAVENDPQALKLDAWKLAIMAGNFILLGELFEDNNEKSPEGLDGIYPLHLAASFLDGGHSCCMVFGDLSRILKPTYAFHHDVDNLGHTILDALIISILRSHTNIRPDFVSYGFHSSNRFPGEEMDICGRWSPDTPRVHDLFRQGFHRIPDTWKHPFCHTSVQAVCHSIIVVYGSSCAPDINKLSGLFTRRCTICGLELKLGPLHALVVATFCLAQHGMSGENLFGAIALLVYLVSLGADATLTVNISAEEILGVSNVAECHHTHLSPFELMLGVPENVVNKWSDDCRLGWNCFAGILSRAEKREDPQPQVNSDSDKEYQPGEGSDDRSTTSTNEDCDLVMGEGEGVHAGRLKLKCHDADMGLLWATIQTEILTYRRVNEGDLWVSKNFSMRALDTWLSSSSVDFLTPLVADRMMRKHSKCGWFHNALEFTCPTADDVSATYFMNMDIYQRATYIEAPDLGGLWYRVERAGEEYSRGDVRD